MRPPRSSIGALGVVVAALALVALAERERAPERDPAGAARPASRKVAGAGLSALRDGLRLELNRAQASDLELLPGIGPQLAARIVEHRRRSGPFRSCDDLMQVHGIGPRTVERLRPLLEVGTGQGGAAGQGGAPSGAAGGAPGQVSNSQSTPAVTVR